MIRITQCVAVACILAFIFPRQLSADEVLARFYEQLRQRNLFGLVEADCLRRLSEATLNSREHGEMVLELSRTYAVHAWQTVGAEQDDLWRRARQVVSEFLAGAKPIPRGELFEAQLALIDLGQAEWCAAQLELQPDNRDLRQIGLAAVDAAIARIAKLEKTTGHDVRQGNPAPTAGKDDARSLSAFERRSLWMQTRFRLGTAQLVQARLSLEKADRASALVAADEWLLPLASGSNAERLTSESQLVLAEVVRLRGDLDRTDKLLKTFEKSLSDDLPSELRERFVIERARWFLAKSLPTEAAAWLIEQRSPKSSGATVVAHESSERAYWQIVVGLELSRLARERRDETLANELWARTQTSLERLAQSDLGYWAQRAKFDWQIAREIRDYGPELAALVRNARSAFAMGKPADAIPQFEQAIAAVRGQPSSTELDRLLRELQDRRASLLFQMQRFHEAAAAFRELAQAPQHDRSAAAHLLWCFALGKLHEQQPTDERRNEFIAALTSLPVQFPDAQEAAEARWLLGRLAEREQRHTDAIELYAAITEKHVRHDDSLAAIARCQELRFVRLRAGKQSTHAEEDAALARLVPAAKAILKLETVAAGSPNSKPGALKTDSENLADESDHKTETLKRSHAELLVRVARLLLERQPADYGLSDQLLEKVINATSPESEWHIIAMQLRVVSLAGQRRIDDAQRLLDALDAAGPVESLSLLDGLSAVSGRTDSATQRLVAEMQLRASDKLAASLGKLTAAQQTRLLRTRAEALTATGQPTAAVATYQKLLDKSPRDAQLLQAVAELCDEIGTRDSFGRAKTYWRRLEGVLKAGSVEWLDARWHVIRNCQRLGERAEADKLLKVTKLLYPELGGAGMKARFVELE